MRRYRYLVFIALFLIALAVSLELERPYYSSILFSLFIAFGGFQIVNKQRYHERGREKIDYLLAKRMAAKQLPAGDAGIKWGGITLPSSYKNKNFLFLGGMGSGKTVAMFALMEQVLRDNTKARAVVHDYKMNITPFLIKMGIDEKRIKIMNPFDVRGCGWDIQKDIKNSIIARELAYVIVPVNPDAKSGKFFDDAARQLVQAGLLYFFYLSLERDEENERRRAKGETELQPIRWTLRDVLNLLRSKEDMLYAFDKYAETRGVIKHLERANNEVETTLISHIENFSPIAALWDGKELVSLNDWIEGEGDGMILVLGFDENVAEMLKAINRLMLNQLLSLVANQKKAEKSESWFFLDEFARIGRIKDFESYVTVVREAMGCMVIATQNIAQLRDRGIGYGPETTNTILQEFKNMWLGKCSGANAEWASEMIGDAEVYEKGESEHQQGFFESYGMNFSKKTKRVVMKEEFGSFQDASFQNGSEAFHLTPLIGNAVYYHRLLPKDLPPVVAETPIQDYRRDTRPRAGDLRPMTQEERKTFALVHVKEEEKEREREDAREALEFTPTVKRAR